MRVRRTPATDRILARAPAIVRGPMRPRRLGQVFARPRSGRPRRVNPRRSGAWTGAGRRPSLVRGATRAVTPAGSSVKATPAVRCGAAPAVATGSEDRAMTGLAKRMTVLIGVIAGLAL